MTTVNRRGLARRAVPAISILLLGTMVAACDRSSGSSGANPTQNASATEVALTVTSNAISGGKNAAEADWYANYVIPKFTEAQKAKGVNVTLKFQPSGVDDEQYKAKMALDLKSKSGADVIALDGIWVGEFADAGYIKPLADVVGPNVTSWDGWAQIPKAVQANASYNDKVYGVPGGTDGRVLYYNKKLFQQAGLPADWKPASWQEILDAGAKLKAVSGVVPIQINAGTAMGEATTMQGALDLLVGTGAEIYQDGKWQGNTQNTRDVLGFYKQLLDQGLMDKNLQQAAKGRDESFAAFAANKIGILLEGDYFWRSVINPDKGSAPMATRDADVGYAEIPAKAKGAGVGGQDLVSMSGGGGTFLNPNTKFPQQAWELHPVHLLARRHQGGAGRVGPHHRATGRQQGGPQQGPAAVADLREGAADHAVPPRPRRLPAGVAGAAAGDRRHRVRQVGRRGRGDLPGRRGEGRRRRGQGPEVVSRQ